VTDDINHSFLHCRGLELSDASISAQIEHLQHNITVKTKENAHLEYFKNSVFTGVPSEEPPSGEYYYIHGPPSAIFVILKSLREAELKNVEEKELRSFLVHQEQISKILTKKQERELVVGSSKIEELMSKIR
jgi:hypothetical protein